MFFKKKRRYSRVLLTNYTSRKKECNILEFYTYFEGRKGNLCHNLVLRVAYNLTILERNLELNYL